MLLIEHLPSYIKQEEKCFLLIYERHWVFHDVSGRININIIRHVCN